MASISAALASALPTPKYTGEDDAPAHAQQRGPRIVGAGHLDQTQVVLRRTGPPPYGQRTGWRPSGQEDFGDGGAFPEVPVAQYPLSMGQKSATASNALAVQVDAEGKVDYGAIARQGHNDSRIIHASFKDLIPLRQRADAGEIDLARPSRDEVAATTEKTKNALAALVSGAVAAQKPKNINVGNRADPTFVRYTPATRWATTRRSRTRARKDKMREEERKLRQSRMGAERRVQVMAREQNRDISEKIALGLAKPTQSKETMYDSRLFNQSSGFDSGFNEDNPYDKPLFAAQDAISSIYRPKANMDEDEDEAAGDKEMAKIQKASRFGEALGRGTFKGAEEAEAREGPVQFEKETADPFNVDKFLSEVEQSSTAKRGYGLQEDESRQTKRARVDDEDD
ncbi:pre-mRNA-processing protein [Verticillium alfalfae VaMs.102]|uniref:Pre-mRNA-processing protein 45 n=1 Tax=Verticillium alfalfae (strain VaMs.102 / ATCC MYA-4576 / FGSC 10136) TaxID=526221 RepID=C9S543_VERA1|nr:pre-mRNA-processing protein [Verticillium alfalfae VaMs.102]EEY14143.1 pre-mRNA-processing protein [Verticillium alfalfae VaMs.102]